MKTETFIENIYYSVEELGDIFTKEDLDELMKNSILVKNTQGKYKFDYVGYLITKRNLIFIIPKIYTTEKFKIEEFRVILNAIKKTEKNYPRERYDMGIESNIEGSIIDISYFLVKDYISRGLYQQNTFLIEEDGFGEINWRKTVEEINPVIQNNRPYYYSYYTNDLKIEEYNYFSQLHKTCVYESFNILKKVGLAQLYGINLHYDDYLARDFFGDNNYLLYKIEQQLLVDFNSRNIEILNLLKSYILKLNQKNSNLVRYYGTTKFKYVWEKACESIFKSELNTSLDQLDKNILKKLNFNILSKLDVRYKSKGNNSNIKFPSISDLISKPCWINTFPLDNESIKYEPQGKFRPDIVYIDEKNQDIIIMDAKYYNFKTITNITDNEKNRIENQPGIGDISKQYCYELVIREIFTVEKIRNVFLLPGNDKFGVNKWGYIEYSIFNHLEDITVVFLPLIETLECYCTNKKTINNKLKSVLDS